MIGKAWVSFLIGFEFIALYKLLVAGEHVSAAMPLFAPSAELCREFVPLFALFTAFLICIRLGVLADYSSGRGAWFAAFLAHSIEAFYFHTVMQRSAMYHEIMTGSVAGLNALVVAVPIAFNALFFAAGWLRSAKPSKSKAH